MKRSLIIFCVVFFLSGGLFGQLYDKELGIEITGAQGSNIGGTVGGVLKFSLVSETMNENYIAFGPSARYQYYWSKNVELGLSGNGSIMGFGGFLHYRFFDWFYLGSALEIIQNPFSPSVNWTFVGFLGGGIHKDLGFVHLNAGLMFDVIDGLRSPVSQVSSPLANNYFIPRTDPNTGQAGGYLPVIARVTFFFPLGRNN